MSYLTKLSLYWRARKEAERDIHASEDFGELLDDEFRLVMTGEEKSKEFHRKPEVDTRIWNICSFEGCRDIVVRMMMTIAMFFFIHATGFTHVPTFYYPFVTLESRDHVLSASVTRDVFAKDVYADCKWLDHLLQHV